MLLQPAFAGDAPIRRKPIRLTDVDNPRPRPPVDTSPWVRNAIVTVVLGMWVVGFVVSILNPSYNIPPAIHTAALMIIGATFGISFYRQGQG